MHPTIKLINRAVVVFTVVIGVPINLYLLFVKGDEKGAFGLCAGIAAIYFVSKVFEFSRHPAHGRDD